MPMQVPERGIETCQGTATVAARVLVLFRLDKVYERLDVGGVATQDPRHDLAMEHRRRDIGVVRGGLPPTDHARVGCDLDEADELVGESFELGDLHGCRDASRASRRHTTGKRPLIARLRRGASAQDCAPDAGLALGACRAHRHNPSSSARQADRRWTTDTHASPSSPAQPKGSAARPRGCWPRPATASS